jgi:hypothetical protein
VEGLHLADMPYTSKKYWSQLANHEKFALTCCRHSKRQPRSPATMISFSTCRRSRSLLDPLSAPSRSVERIGKVLSLARHLSLAELHDTHGVGALAHIGNHILGNP